MSSSRLNLVLLPIVLAFVTSSVAQAHGDEEKTDEGAMKSHHELVHPFMAHMGMPDEPGETSLRVTSMQERNGQGSTGTYAFHIEAGIIDRVGLHLRNDGVGTRKNTELMVQYAVLKSESSSDGLALIGEVEFPTGPNAENRGRGLLGISFALTPVSVIGINSVIHYGPEQKMIDAEIAFVGRLTKTLFPVFELRGESSPGDMTTANSLFACKFKVTPENTIGVAYQIPILMARDYDSQLLMQAEFNF